MSRLLLALGTLGIAISAFIVSTRDPAERVAVTVVIVSISLALGALAALALLRLGAARPACGRAARPPTARALRRGAWIGAAVGLLGALRAVDGLTVVTGGFVVAAFVVAELVLSSRAATSR